MTTAFDEPFRLACAGSLALAEPLRLWAEALRLRLWAEPLRLFWAEPLRLFWAEPLRLR